MRQSLLDADALEVLTGRENRSLFRGAGGINEFMERFYVIANLFFE